MDNQNNAKINYFKLTTKLVLFNFLFGIFFVLITLLFLKISFFSVRSLGQVPLDGVVSSSATCVDVQYKEPTAVRTEYFIKGTNGHNYTSVCSTGKLYSNGDRISFHEDANNGGKVTFSSPSGIMDGIVIPIVAAGFCGFLAFLLFAPIYYTIKSLRK
jgi:hypothetical protein